MRYLILALMTTLPAAFAGDAATKPFLAEFDARYEVKRGRFEVAGARMSLQRTQDGIFRFTSQSEAVGMLAWFMDDVISEESIFRMTDDGFRPVSYKYRHRNSDKNRDESINYDWTSATAELDYRGKVNVVELTPGTVDRFLLQLAAAHGLLNGELEQEHRVLDNGRVKHFNLESREPERVKVPAGSFDTLVISKVDEDDDKHITYWFAPELGYVPVRIKRVKKNEEPIVLNLKKIDSPSEEATTE